MTTELELAYDYCQRIAKEHAKNFYYAFRTLPTKKRRAIYSAYAFCRYCDDIADEDNPFDEKERLFSETRQLLLESQKGHTKGPLFTALDDASHVFGIPYKYYEEVIEGVEMDLTWKRFQTFEELRAYCYKVASIVGLICIEVFGYRDPKAKEYAIDLGIAMQLTNILRDVKEDAERGRIYIPLDEINSYGYSEQDLMDGVVNEPFRRLMRFQTERARRYFDSGSQLFPLLSPESRVCPAVLHGLYSAVLERIESSGFNVFEKRIGLTTREKLLITARLWAANRWPSLPLLSR
ncbi:MAG: phytoene/squalene synthase family protein [Chloroflexi bacterium]|nr:phytoene/squalene synthase family protein [Chloroflexota bacterium]